MNHFICGTSTLEDVIIAMVTDRELIHVEVPCGRLFPTGVVDAENTSNLETRGVVYDRHEQYFSNAIRVARICVQHSYQSYINFQANAAGSVTFALNGYVAKHEAVNSFIMWHERPVSLLHALCRAFPTDGVRLIVGDSLLRFCFDTNGVLDHVVEMDDGGC